MKKSLLAVAAIGAFASAAQAQSSVTVYGILDVGYVGANSTVQSGATVGGYTPAPDNSAYPSSTLKNTQSQFGQSAEQTSRLGFKGTEDLGGGTSAFFTAEFGLAPQEQTLSGNTAGGLKNRQTFVGLKKAGLGDAAIGVQYTPVHIAVGKTDPGQQNNMTGSVIYTGQADSGVVGGVAGNANAYTSRVANSLTLNTEVISGFQAHAIAILNNANQTAIDAAGTGNVKTGGVNNTNGWGLGADYTWNKFFITANYQSIKQLTAATNYTTYAMTGASAAGAAPGNSQLFATAAATGPAGGCAGTAIASSTTIVTNGMSISGQGCNIQDNQGYVGATYDFGILKAYASWIQRKASDTANSAVYQKRSAEQIGVRSFITPTIEGWASAGVGTFTPYGLNQNSAHFNAWQLGSNYWLSKRTNLYAIYGQYAQGTAAVNIYNTTTGVVTSSPNSSVNANSYAVGVRHTF